MNNINSLSLYTNLCLLLLVDSLNILIYHYLAHPRNGAIILYHNGYTSPSYYYGIVRVYYNNGWGNVCSDYYYSSIEANVICHQLGYTGVSSYSRAGIVRFEVIIMHVVGIKISCSKYIFLDMELTLCL